MTNKIKPELSEKNKYWIPKHRYYELLHFCLQYPEWKSAYKSISYISASNMSDRKTDQGDPVSKAVEKLMFYQERMDTVDNALKEADPSLYIYLFKGVTENLSYDIIRVNMNIPCCRETYYEAYRRFFWLLDKARN